MAAIETYLERLRAIGDQTQREEVITRRVLWALRGSNDEPAHPDRANLNENFSSEEDECPKCGCCACDGCVNQETAGVLCDRHGCECSRWITWELPA